MRISGNEIKRMLDQAVLQNKDAERAAKLVQQYGKGHNRPCDSKKL